MRLEEYFNKTFLGTLFLWRDAHTRIGASSNRCKEYLLLASRLGKAAECPWRIRGDLRRYLSSYNSAIGKKYYEMTNTAYPHFISNCISCSGYWGGWHYLVVPKV
jgi:hypothetical protein